MKLPHYCKTYFLPFLLLALIFISFWNVRNHDFIDDFDDNLYVLDNPHITSGLSLNDLKWALTADVCINWHPVTLMSHMLDCQLFGLNPGKHHLMNVFFHLLNTLLLFIVLKQMTGRHWESFIVALLFGLHPIHVESVAWVSERKDVLSTFFGMLAIGSYAWYSKQPSIKRYVLIFFFYLLGIMSKPMIVTLPCVLLLLDYWPLERFTLYPRPENKNRSFSVFFIVEKIPLFILSAISSIITYRLQKYSEGVHLEDVTSLSFRISNALVSYVKYIYKLFFPVNLSILYPFPEHIPWWHILLSSIFLLAITAVVIRSGKRYPFLPVGWFWYLGTLIPVIGIVKVGAQAMADRYMYIPSIGLFIIIAWGVPLLLSRWRFKMPFLAILLSVIAMSLAFTTWLQVRHWSNTITLFEHALAVDENNTLAHNHLGVTMARYGLAEETVRHTSQGLKKNQNRPAGRRFNDNRLNQTYAKTYYTLGKSLFQKNNIDAAIIHFQEALLADPNHAETRHGLEQALKIQEKEIQEAEQIQDALKQNPSDPRLYSQLGNYYWRRGDMETAEAQYRKALSVRPADINALMKLAELMAVRGQYEKSVFFYRQVISLEPHNPEAYYHLASIYARRRKIDESVDWLKKAVENGYYDWNRLKKDKSFQAIHETAYYQAVIK